MKNIPETVCTVTPVSMSWLDSNGMHELEKQRGWQVVGGKIQKTGVGKCFGLGCMT